jgi:hypothetical protein
LLRSGPQLLCSFGLLLQQPRPQALQLQLLLEAVQALQAPQQLL